MSSRSFVLAVGVLAASLSVTSCSRDPHKLKLKYVAAGDALVTQKKHSEAIIQYRNAVAQDGNYGEARLKLGSAYQEVGDFPNAYREFIRAADLLPDNVDAQLRAGSLRLSAGEYPEAKARAMTVLAKDAKNVDALILLGNALAGLKDIDKAIVQIEEAVEADPHTALSYANLGALQLAKGQRSAAEGAFKRAVEVNPKSIAARLNLGDFYWAGGQLADAEREFKAALEVDAKSTAVARTLATFYIDSGRRAEAEPFLKAYAAGDAGAKVVLADYYLDAGRIEEAKALLTPLAKEPDGFVAATLRLAAISFQEGKKPQAYDLIESILKRFPNSEPAQEVKARFLMREGRFTDAIALSDAVIKRNPNALGSLYTRAASLEATRSFDKALTAFHDLLAKTPSSLAVQLKIANLYLVRGDTKSALSFLTAILKAQPQLGDAHYLLGQTLLRTGNLPAAERQLIGVAKALPKSADAQTWLGLLYQVKGDATRARAAFSRAQELEPNSEIALAGLISQDVSEKKSDAVRARLESALAKSPKSPAVLMLAGNAYGAIGDHEKAEAAYQRLIQVDPGNMDAYGKLAIMYHGQQRLDEAKTKYEELARHQDKPVAAMTLLGMIFELQNDRKGARARYERALELDHNAGIAANNLAWIYADGNENLDIALQLAQTAKSQLPDVPQVNDTLGWVYYKKGMATMAVTFLREATKREGSNPSMQYRLGLAYLKAGDQRNARASLEQALKLNPQFEQADDAKRALATIKG